MSTYLKTTYIIAICSLILSCQDRKVMDSLAFNKRMEDLNHNIECLYINQSVDSLASMYESRISYMPEYKPAIFSRKELKEFFTSWFEVTDFIDYKRNANQFIEMEDYVVEIGTFNLKYINADDKNSVYDGKYMVVWHENPQHDLRIISEIFGAKDYVTAEEVPYSMVNVAERIPVINENLETALMKEIEDYNQMVIDVIEAGNGKSLIKNFTENGVYMPQFDSIFVGIAEIELHLAEPYTLNGQTNIGHTFYDIYDLGTMVLVNGQYLGIRGTVTDGGKFHVNLSSLLKIMPDSTFKMHWQMVNKDKQDIVKLK